jgi:lysophospholipase L1-like esterase
MWLAYDLSHIPSSRRSRVLVVWYNETFNYDHTLIDDNAYDIPSTYTIDINPAPGGRKPPTSGWITRVTVTNNHYHSRQAIIDMANNNWLRINITASDGSPQNYYVSLNMDVFDASKGTADDFLFLGASITAGTMGHQTAAGTKSFAQLINARLPDRFPVEEDGGVATLTSGDAVQYINTWLPLFPGRYVGLSYGTNDALYCANPIDFYKNYVIMVRAIIKAGKVPIVSHISWSTNQNVQHCAPALNAQLDKLENAYPQVIKGPDFWALFRNHPELLADGIHPNDKGIALYRRAWANMVLTSIYHSSSTTA